ncbi:MAG: hypothetical protein ACI4SB_05420 [Acutalibacteraceae bacterium]
MKQNNYINKVIITGEISNIFVITPKRILLTVRIGCNYPQIFCTDNNADYVFQHCTKGQRVTVKANIQSSFKENLGRITTIFADDVTAVADDVYLPSENRFSVACEITRITEYTRSNIVRLSVKTYVNNHSSNFVLSFYNPDKRLINSFCVGQFVCFTGMVQTSKQILEDGSAKYHENFVVDFPKEKMEAA